MEGGRLWVGCGPVVVRMVLGARLRWCREGCGVSREVAGAVIGVSGVELGLLELGRVGFSEGDVVGLLGLYGVVDVGVREGLVGLARGGGVAGWWCEYGDVVPGWFEFYVGLEQGCSVVRTYEPGLVPGLLQTEQCARGVIGLGCAVGSVGSVEEVERRVALRMRRQEVLRSVGGPSLWAVVDEGALWRLGGRVAMRAQVRYLLEMAELPNVTLQVVPFHCGGQVGVGGPFTILRFAASDLPDVVYLEQLTSALYLDGECDVEHYLVVMDRLCVQAKSPAQTIKFLHSLGNEI
ncbi:MAG: helix-turn-helix domain-containing protein [Pseudonocardiaceae bacterium]